MIFNNRSKFVKKHQWPIFRSLTEMLSFCELDGALVSESCKMFLVLRYWSALHEKFMHSYSYAILLSIIIYKP